MNEHIVVDCVDRLLRWIEGPDAYDGEELRHGIHKTPARVARAYGEIFRGYGQDVKDVLTTFESTCDEIVVLRDVEFYSTCEHHMLPFFGRAHIGYLPNGKVLGISKLARILDIFTRRLQIQERIGTQVTEALMEHLGPLGCGVVLEAQHLCMVARGVSKQNSVMVTSSMQGVFQTDASVKAEFLRMIGR